MLKIGMTPICNSHLFEQAALPLLSAQVDAMIGTQQQNHKTMHY